MRHFDQDGSGSIDYNEFVDALVKAAAQQAGEAADRTDSKARADAYLGMEGASDAMAEAQAGMAALRMLGPQASSCLQRL